MYPPIEPYDSGHLDVGDGHSIYWEIVGSPDGTPAVWLHGGPGSASSPNNRRNFDPSRYRAILFHQRGCGRSRPLASDPDADLSTNTTGHLVGDIERLRTHLGIDRWVVVGGSWGVTLALVYAERYPERVLGMVLAAVTSGRWQETRWITRDMGGSFPGNGTNSSNWCPTPSEAATSLRPTPGCWPAPTGPCGKRRPAAGAPGRTPTCQLVFARLVTHYWGHGCFLADHEVMANLPRIAHIPAVLIHGLQDVSGPLDTAWELHKAWPASRLVVVDDAGHFGGSMGEEFAAAIDVMVLGIRTS